VTKLECASTQSFPRTDHHLAAGGVELQHIERLLGRHADPFALTDRVIDDAAVAAEHPSIDVDDIAGLGGARAQALDHLRVAPGRHEADILAVGLLGDSKPEVARKLARLVLPTMA